METEHEPPPAVAMPAQSLDGDQLEEPSTPVENMPGRHHDELADGGCSCSQVGEQAGDWLAVPLDQAHLSGDFTTRPFHTGSLSDWVATRVKGSHFSPIAHRSGGSAHRHRALAQRDTVRSELVHVKSVTFSD
ncbi:unnamed protein product [Pleuronectes platessa]|uniref:Uncharacterized protein n=1 Tax=Pleuronectes platessa TaxID=8262 RepID=A0A9N7UFB4_PLEPL|nr:unnamed protein product [Pleuronectes platessa]